MARIAISNIPNVVIVIPVNLSMTNIEQKWQFCATNPNQYSFVKFLVKRSLRIGLKK